jgi:hypothetical protein
MNRIFKIWLIAIFIIGVGANLVVYISIKVEQYLTKNLFEQVENHDKLYVYETYFGSLNAVMYVEDVKDTADLINYYNRIAKRDTTAYINFPIKCMPISLYVPIYVYKYLNKSSKVVELVDFDVKCWGYIRGYVYKPTTHEHPPADSLIKSYELDMAKYNSKKEVQTIRQIKERGISAYGWYCKYH